MVIETVLIVPDISELSDIVMFKMLENESDEIGTADLVTDLKMLLGCSVHGCGDDSSRLILRGQEIAAFEIERLGPEVVSLRAAYVLGGETHRALVHPAHAALQHH